MNDDWRLRRALEALETVPPARLRALADWFDAQDRRALATALGTSEAEVPEAMVRAGGDVQRDLRKMADFSEEALGDAA